MLCKACKREISENSIYCNWCGEKQIRERKKKGEIKVPNPRQLKSGNWNIELAAEGQSVTEPTRDLCNSCWLPRDKDEREAPANNTGRGNRPVR